MKKSFFLLCIVTYFQCADPNRQPTMHQVYTNAGRWLSGPFNNSLKKAQYLTPEEKANAEAECKVFKNRFKVQTQFNENFPIYRYAFNWACTLPAWALSGLFLGATLGISPSEDPVAKAVTFGLSTLVVSPLFVIGYGKAVTAHNKSVDKTYKDRKAAINKMPDYLSQD